jgi:2-succinyl-5-enolpyruvyl-6-hydroxy-3-cyclohexene-1-carboxylate synthase
MMGRIVRTPLIVVVINNGGGRIFEQLPVANKLDQTALELFTTPQDCAIEHAARLYGHEYVRAQTGVEFRSALESALSHRWCTVLEAVVPPHGAYEYKTRVMAALRRQYAA